MELEAVLTLLMTAGSGTLAWWLLDRIKWFGGLEPDTKRYVAYALSAAIAIVAYLGLVAIGSQIPPVGVVPWIKCLWLVGTSSFGLATLLNTGALKKYRSDAVENRIGQ